MVSTTTGDNGEEEDCELLISCSDYLSRTGCPTFSATKVPVVGELLLAHPIRGTPLQEPTSQQQQQLRPEKSTTESSRVDGETLLSPTLKIKILEDNDKKENQVQFNKRMVLVRVAAEKLPVCGGPPSNQSKLVQAQPQPKTTRGSKTTHSTPSLATRAQTNSPIITTPALPSTAVSTMINELTQTTKHTRRRRKQVPGEGDKHQLGAERKPERSQNGSGCFIECQLSVSGNLHQQREGIIEDKKSLLQHSSGTSAKVIKRAGSPSKRTRVTLGSFSKVACSRYQIGPINIMCWPTWRQLIVLSFLSILMTSLLANFNIIKPSGSSCRLFNQCHALSVVQTVSSQQTPISVSNPLPVLPVAPIQKQQQQQQFQTQPQSPSPAPSAQLQQPPPTAQSQPSSIASSTSTSTTRGPWQPTSPAGLHQLAASASTTAVTTATLNAPNQQVATNANSSLVSRQPATAENHQQLDVFHEHSEPQPEASNKLGLAPLASSSQAPQQQKHRSQTTKSPTPSGSANRSSHRWPEVGDSGQQKFSYDNLNSYHTILNSNDNSIDENNNTGNNGPAGGRFSSNGATSSITRNQQQQAPVAKVSETTSGRPTAAMLEEREGSIVGGRQRAPTQFTALNAHQPAPVPMSPQQSSNQAIKVVEAPAFSLVNRALSYTHRFPAVLNGSGSTTSLSSSIHESSASNRSPLTNSSQRQQQQLNGLPEMWNYPTMRYSGTTGGEQLNEPTTLTSLNISLANEPMNPQPQRGTTISSAYAEPLTFMPPIESREHNSLGPQHQHVPMPMEHSRYGYSTIQQAPAGLRSPMVGSASLPQGLLQTFVQLNELLPQEPFFSAASASQPLVLSPQKFISAYLAGADHQQMPQLMAAAGGLSAPFSFTRQPMSMSNIQQADKGGHNKRQVSGKHLSSASASAPSISLPPLSHFLGPRNPFRLFASSSSSTPMTIRYRPSLLGGSSIKGSAGGSNNAGNSRNNNLNQQQHHANNNRQQQVVAWSASHQPPLAKVGPIQGMTSLASSLNQEPTRLYAHSHSAKQLEQLVRAASQATGIHTPILPAIVSAPTGTIPGFYIPAIESESESQVNEMRYGESVGSIVSKIPGTDYVLHPDEVRAMMSIGDAAWRKQQAATSQSQQSPQYQPAPGSNSPFDTSYKVQINQPADQIQQLASSMSGLHNNWNSGNNYMQENHLQNARDFSFIEPTGRTIRRDINPNQRNQLLNSSLLESQLNHHFKQNNLNSFPAIIRVNDQDYVHWPLIKLGGGGKQMDHQAGVAADNRPLRTQPWSNTEESRQLVTASFSPFQALYQVVNPPSQQAHSSLHQQSLGAHAYNSPATHQNGDQRLHQASNLHAFSPVPFQSNRLSLKAANSNDHESIMKQETRGSLAPIVDSGQSAGGKIEPVGKVHQMTASSKLSSDSPETDRSPVRLATQLTPSEIRQVEDSIIETLIVAQTLERQRKMMHQLAASLNSPVHVQRPPVAVNNNKHEPKSSRARRVSSMFKGGFFGRRRRRNTSAKKQQKEEEDKQQRLKLQQFLMKPQLLALASPSLHQHQHKERQNLALLPLMTINATNNRAQLVTFLDGSPEVEGPALELENEPSSVLESKISNQQSRSLLADQETNKPFGSVNNHHFIEPIESHHMDGEATEPRATYMQPEARSLDSSDSSSALVDRPTESVFGSRVVRNKANVKSTPVMAPKYKPENSERLMAATRGSLDTSSSKLKPTHHYSDPMGSFLTGRGSSRYQQPKIADEGESGLASGPASIRHIGDGSSREYRGRVDADWPPMASDADYFPSSQHDDSTFYHTNDEQRPHSGVRRHKSRTFGSNDNNDRRVKNHLDRSRARGSQTQPNTSSSLKSYVTSQLKLQFAQDYTAREGVPIYNNNVRVAGALTRPRSQSSVPHPLPPRTTESQAGSEGSEPDEPEDADESEEKSRPNGMPLDTSASKENLQISSFAPELRPSKVEPMRRLRPPTRKHMHSSDSNAGRPGSKEASR